MQKIRFSDNGKSSKSFFPPPKIRENSCNALYKSFAGVNFTVDLS
ncbi:hypothetical protein LEP1GSC133_5164 [Leptospira borgpetersenii serovar Pomona str. 200901868]|uniref:Uncharacterized protein n=1 Tax=Leptospira borgpetersenii serovar Pomona str. 200901868 TaxID=1192866 RepID=M6W0G7_LEPBO|nr:hypothetical protein LEP1GSC133_5164 [Leptospira borgpetersenii serovar Pomona str. 200901868]